MLTSAEFAEIERRCELLVTKNHHRFLSDALACLRRTRDPVAVFELLARMSGRDSELDALQDVRRWYDQLLARPGRLGLDKLELWLTWTRRLARILECETDGRPSQGTARQRSRDTRPAMALDAQLRALRQKYPAPPPSPPRPPPPGFSWAAPSATPSPQPEDPRTPELPRTLAVLFRDHSEAVKALKAALTSPAGTGKRSPKPIPLVPAAGKFPAGLAAVVFDPTDTAGITAYLQALTKTHHGAAFPFFVTDLACDGGRVVTRTILLTLPKPE